MFSHMRGWELLVIATLVLLLFGAKRLPDVARGVGRSLRIFKAETRNLAEAAGAEDEESEPIEISVPDISDNAQPLRPASDLSA